MTTLNDVLFAQDSLLSAISAVCNRVEEEISRLDPDSGSTIDQYCHAALALATASAVLGGDAPVPEALKKRMLDILESPGG